MTIEEARAARVLAEDMIHNILKKLSRDTDLDLVGVHVQLIVTANGDGDPRRFAQAVRIELAV